MLLSDDQYNQIKRIYEERRRKHERLSFSRREELYTKIPELRALDGEIADCSMACTERMLRTPDAAGRAKLSEELQAKIDAIEDRKLALITGAGYPDDYLEATYECELCADTGSVDGHKCRCFRQIEAMLLSDESRIRAFLERNNFSRLDEHYYVDEDLTRFRDAVQKSKQFINSFGKDYHNLLFYGTVGTGKSFLSGCVAKELLDQGYPVLYFSAELLFETISSATKSYDPQALPRLHSALYETDLLIIDDLGTEYSNSFTKTQLLNLLNERILRCKPVIISTNKNLNELRDTYSERFNSRLVENTYICRLSGKDIRIQIKLEETNGSNAG